jgi:nucleotide-binding universal stress UspA family protein
MHIARALAQRGLEVARVIAVQPPVFISEGWQPAIGEAQRELESLGVQKLGEAVDAQLRRFGAAADGWPRSVETGPPGMVIADAADAIGASLILLGVGRHSVLERWFGGETALDVVQLTRVPVLAAHPDARGLPRSALVAEDFSAYSREAGWLARDLVAPGGELHVAHVLHLPPGTRADIETGDWVGGYLESAAARLADRRRELDPSGEAGIEIHPLVGDPADELLRLAATLQVELIAAGRHGHGVLGRLLMGSVSNRLVRRASCSVLIVPPDAAAPSELPGS